VRKPKPTVEYILDRMEPEPNSGCWLWLGGRGGRGYGMVRDYTIHRLLYEALVGSIPDDHEVHHLCHVQLCLNPTHLKVLSTSEHKRVHNWQILKQACVRGHPFTPENTYITVAGGRQCMTCDRARKRRALTTKEE
jgi:hypothetical protein